MLNKLRVTMAAIAAVVVFNGYALAQAVIGSPIGTTIDLSPMLSLGLQMIALVVMLFGVWFIYKHTTDTSKRAALTGILEKGVAFALNAVAGATANKNLSVNLGTSTAATVAATALKYVQEFGPQAVAHFGLDEKSVAKMIVARLPGVDGAITDDTLNSIVAAAQTPTPGTVVPLTTQVQDSLPLLAQMLGDYLLQKKATAAAANPTVPPA